MASAQGLGEVKGTVKTTSGTPIAGALVSLRGRGAPVAVRSDTRGSFDFGRLAGGLYEIDVSARGFETFRGGAIAVGPNGTSIQVTLAPLQPASLLVVGHAFSNGASTLSTAPVPSVEINAQQYAAQGVTRVSDILSDALSTTVYPIIGGGLNAPAVVALRGPDPSETLVDVDGHQVNNGSTGDFDLSLLDPADLESVQVIYGIAPSALYGPNTLGGALNVVTLEPTLTQQDLERFSYGSYGTFTGTLQASGSDGRFGYAVSFHRMTSAGQLDNAAFPNTIVGTPSPGTCTLQTCPVGNDMSAQSDLAKLRYSFGDGGFIGLSFYDQAVYRDLSATLSSIGPPSASTSGKPLYSNFSGSSVESNDDAYGLDLYLPLGSQSSILLRHQTSLVSQIVNGGAAGSSPYLYNDRDLIGDDTLEFDHTLSHAQLSFKASLTGEDLTTDNILGVIYADSYAQNPVAQDEGVSAWPSPLDSVTTTNAYATIQHLGQTERWIGGLYTDDPTPKLHYSFAAYDSDYSTFGHSIDPRFGFVWTPTAESAVRASVGSTFQSPQLPTFIVPTSAQPIPVVAGYASIGNKGATAERSTEYDLGYERLFALTGHDVHASLDVYRTDLHNGVATFYGPKQCTTDTVTLAGIASGLYPDCLSYPVNVTREVYQGVELRTQTQLTPGLTLLASYDIDSAYIQSFPPSAADGVVPFEQDLGVPLHKIALALEDEGPRFSYYAGLLYEGDYNELNLPPYATLRAGMTWHVRSCDLTLAGENLTNAYDFLYTRAGGGVPYGALPAPIATDAYPLPGRRVTFIVTHKM